MEYSSIWNMALYQYILAAYIFASCLW